ncbi:nitrogen regulation protein NR(II) [Inmirania thermothiophila]|uniref:Sensory histidine kinase/phosphatase NtrB n=1 Tax=Inmirania thermothiophila TaxID=1750597 RepID=A0A3N1Y9A5_9GAMM|nr:nitrogen regulation protein NR(II) [Inmirania thermothiophila]ROR34192.1 two-component system nitrogen regulation sensor histidine kinase GlnL [Inmirania thermothiophila]
MDPPRYDLLLDHLTTAVLLLAPDGRLRHVNAAGEDLLGLSRRQVLAMPLSRLLRSGPLAERLARAARTGQPFTEREARLALADGRTVTVDCTVTPMGDPPADLVVELQVLDRLLQIAREDQLRSRQQVTASVLRGLAHEIRNPLGGLRGAAQLLGRELGASPLREYVEVILAEADRLGALLDRMLGPSRQPRRRRINLHEVTERVRHLLAAEAPEARVVADYDPSIPELTADADGLIQAVLNLGRNALQATGGRGRVVLRTRVQRQFTIGERRHRLVARIEVEDDGPGVPPQLQEQIFYPLVTTRPEGTGLGLSIAQDIAVRHGGLVECESAPGRTIFTLLLPLEERDG